MKRSFILVLLLLLTGTPVRSQMPDDDAAGLHRRIARLIDQLGSLDFAEREAAHRSLLEIGPPAVEQLKQARDSDDAEIAGRARRLYASLTAKLVQLIVEDRPYFIGEPIKVEFVVTNPGPAPLRIDFGGNYRGAGRHERFVVKAVDERGNQAEDTLIQVFQMGGIGGERELQEGDQFRAVLNLPCYRRLDRPGTYTVSIAHDLGLKRDEPPAASFTLNLVEPTPAQARAVVHRMKQMPADANRTWGEGGDLTRDFATICHPVYLPIMIEMADAGDADGVEGLRNIRTVEATEALLDLVIDSDSAAIADTAWRYLQFDPRLPNRQYWRRDPEGSLPEWYAPHRRWVKVMWGDRLTPKVMGYAEKAIASDDPVLIQRGAAIYTAIGTSHDAARLIGAIDRLVAGSPPPPIDPGDPRFGTLTSLASALAQLPDDPQQGITDPTTPGQRVAFVVALARHDDFRPPGWADVIEYSLREDGEQINALVMPRIPADTPVAALDGLARYLAAGNQTLRRAALQAIRKRSEERWREPVLDLLHTLDQGAELTELDQTAVKLGVPRDRVMDIYQHRLTGEADAAALACMMQMLNVPNGGYSSRSEVAEKDAKIAAGAWRTFIDANRQAIRDNAEFVPGKPPLTPQMFPPGFSYYVDGKPWPNR